ncbi:MAG: hypothetical protein K9J21_06845 [Bacteroidales bacterium]|nr:hypothetical protein [Bacteroidales bacterium]
MNTETENLNIVRELQNRHIKFDPVERELGFWKGLISAVKHRRCNFTDSQKNKLKSFINHK